MEGFFTKKEVESISRPNGKTLSCISCGRHKDCNSPRLKPTGNFKKKILNIGTAPTLADDKAGIAFQGKEGRVLQRAYKKCGVDLYEDCLNTFALQCYDNAELTNYQIDCCRKRILNVINEYKPEVIVLLGLPAVQSVIGHRWKRDLGTITKWRGWTIPDQDLQAWVCPTFDIDFVEGNDQGAEETIWLQDLRLASLKRLDKFPVYVEPEIEIISDLSPLNSIKDPFAFDFETTGIRPNAEGHKIICCSVADTSDHAYVFMMPKTRGELKPFINLLLDDNVGKIAQNMKFENSWCKVRLGIDVKGWLWDTMIATHVLDNREGITSLKFQTYVQLGVIDYESEVAPYLKAVGADSANAINRIEELLKIPGGAKKLMTYCGYDGINEHRLSKIQRAEIVLPF